MGILFRVQILYSFKVQMLDWGTRRTFITLVMINHLRNKDYEGANRAAMRAGYALPFEMRCVGPSRPALPWFIPSLSRSRLQTGGSRCSSHTLKLSGSFSRSNSIAIKSWCSSRTQRISWSRVRGNLDDEILTRIVIHNTED